MDWSHKVYRMKCRHNNTFQVSNFRQGLPISCLTFVAPLLPLLNVHTSTVTSTVPSSVTTAVITENASTSFTMTQTPILLTSPITTNQVENLSATPPDHKPLKAVLEVDILLL